MKVIKKLAIFFRPYSYAPEIDQKDSIYQPIILLFLLGIITYFVEERIYNLDESLMLELIMPSPLIGAFLYSLFYQLFSRIFVRSRRWKRMFLFVSYCIITSCILFIVISILQYYMTFPRSHIDIRSSLIIYGPLSIYFFSVLTILASKNYSLHISRSVLLTILVVIHSIVLPFALTIIILKLL